VVQIEGHAEVLSPDVGLDAEALKNLHGALSDEYPDWEVFLSNIHAEGRVAIRFVIEHAGGVTHQ
jgi:hypothetical protein